MDLFDIIIAKKLSGGGGGGSSDFSIVEVTVEGQTGLEIGVQPFQIVDDELTDSYALLAGETYDVVLYKNHAFVGIDCYLGSSVPEVSGDISIANTYFDEEMGEWYGDVTIAGAGTIIL